MRFERLTSPQHPLYKRAMALYADSVPPHEQRENASQLRILGDEAYRFNLIYDENTFVGLALCWRTERFIYLEHFCILPELRSHGYGRQALALLAADGLPVILEIDPPVDAVSIRRRGFYQRCGFVENPYPHVHPPYHAGHAGHALVILTAPGAISAEEYAGFADFLRERVMKDAY